MCSRKSAEDDFPALWKAAGDEIRKKHYFTAMERICEIPDMEKQRKCVTVNSSTLITLLINQPGPHPKYHGRHSAPIMARAISIYCLNSRENIHPRSTYTSTTV